MAAPELAVPRETEPGLEPSAEDRESFISADESAKSQIQTESTGHRLEVVPKQKTKGRGHSASQQGMPQVFRRSGQSIGGVWRHQGTAKAVEAENAALEAKIGPSGVEEAWEQMLAFPDDLKIALAKFLKEVKIQKGNSEAVKEFSKLIRICQNVIEGNLLAAQLINTAPPSILEILKRIEPKRKGGNKSFVASSAGF